MGHLKPAGRGTSWVEVTFLRKKDGIVRILSPLGPGHGPWVGHKPPFLWQVIAGVCVGRFIAHWGYSLLGAALAPALGLLLCARPCSRCGGYCQEQAFTHCLMNGDCGRKWGPLPAWGIPGKGTSAGES